MWCPCCKRAFKRCWDEADCVAFARVGDACQLNLMKFIHNPGTRFASGHVKRPSARLGAARSWRWVLCALSVLSLCACSLVMPKEISEMEARTSAAAARLAKERPDAFKAYRVGGRDMGYVQTGADAEQPLVIFLHGSPGDWSGWVDYLVDPDLMRRARLVAVDRPGFGRSGKGLVERSLVEQAKDVAPLLDQAQPGQRVLLVGHSYGGPLAARLAMDYGNKVTDLLILAGSIDPALEETAWYQYPADWPPLTWLLPGELLVTNREIRALQAELQQMLPLWPRITQRVTVMQGGQDGLVPPANADFAQRVLKAAQPLNMMRLPEANHFIPWTRFELVKAQIIQHLL
jgi:pimeloyl-ACP methyl ester carboxylesterase